MAAITKTSVLKYELYPFAPWKLYRIPKTTKYITQIKIHYLDQKTYKPPVFSRKLGNTLYYLNSIKGNYALTQTSWDIKNGLKTFDDYLKFENNWFGTQHCVVYEIVDLTCYMPNYKGLDSCESKSKYELQITDSCKKTIESYI